MNNIILIGGASGSIGSFLMNYFSQQGYIVYGIGRTHKNFNNPNCHYFVLDINDELAVSNYFSFFRQNKIKINYYIHCIGIDVSAPIGLLSKAGVKDAFAKETTSSIMFIKEVASLMMLNKQGLLLNFSSIVVSIANQGSALYGMSKISLEYLFKIIAKEYGRFGVHTCSVRLPLIENSNMSKGLSGSFLEELRKHNPITLDELALIINEIILGKRSYKSGEVFEL